MSSWFSQSVGKWRKIEFSRLLFLSDRCYRRNIYLKQETKCKINISIQAQCTVLIPFQPLHRLFDNLQHNLFLDECEYVLNFPPDQFSILKRENERIGFCSLVNTISDLHRCYFCQFYFRITRYLCAKENKSLSKMSQKRFFL